MEILKEHLFKINIPFMCWLGPKNFLIIDHPDDIHTVMNGKECMEKSDMYRFFNRGVSLFAAPGECLG